MSTEPDDIVFLGLSLSSSWGNGHATTYRALLRGLAAYGSKVLFLERDVAWYAANRDLPAPDFCELAFYETPEDLARRFGWRIAAAKAVIVGSYVPDGIAVIDLMLRTARGVRGFYDVDTPVTLKALSDGEAHYIAARQIPALDLYLSFTGGPTLELLTRIYGARQARTLYCAVDETRYCPVDAAMRWDLGYLGTYSADRQPILDRLLLATARLLPERRFVVAGPQYPADIDWPDNVERIEHLPPEAHAAFYAAQRFTLNVTRAAMIAAGWSPSVRLFEAASCGTPIISDRWPGLDDLLPEGDAIVIADGTDVVVEAIVETSEPRRHGMAQRARDIVLRDHTGKARAATLQQYLAAVSATAPAANVMSAT